MLSAGKGLRNSEQSALSGQSEQLRNIRTSALNKKSVLSGGPGDRPDPDMAKQIEQWRKQSHWQGVAPSQNRRRSLPNKCSTDPVMAMEIFGRQPFDSTFSELPDDPSCLQQKEDVVRR